MLQILELINVKAFMQAVCYFSYETGFKRVVECYSWETHRIWSVDLKVKNTNWISRNVLYTVYIGQTYPLILSNYWLIYTFTLLQKW